jgi:hypothetical protein
MRYGLEVNGYNGYSVLNSNAKTMVYKGKAFILGTGPNFNYYPQDRPTLFKTYDVCSFEFGGQDTGGIFPDGYFLLTCYHTFCDNYEFEAHFSDSISFWTYGVFTESRPVIFIHCALGYKANVIDISQAEGSSLYTIGVMVSFPLGNRDEAFIDANVTLYCFHTTQLIATGLEYGLELYDENGTLTYSSGNQPAMIKDVYTVTDMTVSGGQLTVEHGLLDDPPISAFILNKPAVLAIDWLRLDLNHYTNAYNSCGTPRKALFVLSHITSLPTFENGLINLHVHTVECQDFSCCHSASNQSGISINQNNSIEMPVEMPIIEGADYD